MQGVYRGLQDTTTPFYATVAANGLNVVLGWAFIFVLHLGVRGAAIATVTAQVSAIMCNPGRQGKALVRMLYYLSNVANQGSRLT